MARHASFPQSLLIVSNELDDGDGNDSNNKGTINERLARPKIVEIDSKDCENSGKDDVFTPKTTSRDKDIENVLISQQNIESVPSSFASTSNDSSETSKTVTSSLPSRISMLFIAINSKSNSSSSENIVPQLTQFMNSIKDNKEFFKIWEIILNGVITHLSSSPDNASKLSLRQFSPHFTLGVFMMETHPSSLSHLCTFLKNAPDKASKTLAMATIYFINYCLLQRNIRKNDDKNTRVEIKANKLKAESEDSQTSELDLISSPLLLRKCLPLLYNQLIEPVGTKRTNLSVLAMDLAFFLIHENSIIALQQNALLDNKGKDAIAAIWSSLPLISKLLDRKRIWTSHTYSKPSSSSAEENATRKRCSITVLDDFCSVARHALTFYQQCECEEIQKKHQGTNKSLFQLAQTSPLKDLKTDRNQSKSMILSNDSNDVNVTVLHVCFHLAGVEIPRKSTSSLTEMPDSYPIRIGGLFHCLGSNPNKHLKTMFSIFEASKNDTSSIYYNLFNSSNMTHQNYDIYVVKNALSMAIALFQKHREEEQREKEAIAETQRCIVRTLAAFLASKSQTSMSKLKSSYLSTLRDNEINGVICERNSQASIWDIMINDCLNLLRSQSEDCINLCLASLNRLWADSKGLPPDLANFCDTKSDQNHGENDLTTPSSFQHLLDSIQELSHSSISSEDIMTKRINNNLDAPIRAICTLVAQCIRSQPKILLPFFLKKTRIESESTPEILSLLITTTVSADNMGLEQNTSTTSDSQFLKECISTLLLDNLSNAFLHKRCNSSELFLSLDKEKVIPRLIDELLANKNNAKNDEISVSTTMSSDSLLYMLLHTNQIQLVINILVHHLCQIENKNDKSKSLDNLYKVASQWRRKILSSGGDELFSDILTAVGKCMFQYSSKSSPLSLFGSLVGDGSTFPHPTSDACMELMQHKEKITLATTLVMKLGLDEIKRVEEHIDVSKTSNMLLKRLSPLLMLRRVPSIYYKIMHTWLSDRRNDSQTTVSVLSHLSQALASILGSDTSKERTSLSQQSNTMGSQSVFTAEERRLAAELAGRCLPFFITVQNNIDSINQSLDTYSCFRIIVAPTFCSTLLSLNAIENSKKSVTDMKECQENIKKSRGALYAVCNHLSIAHDKDDATGFMVTVVFCLEILSKNKYDGMNESFQEDLIQLQTGCINFFSLCLNSWGERNIERKKEVEKRWEGVQSKSPMIEEISSSTNNPIIHEITEGLKEIRVGDNVQGYFKSLSNLFALLLTVITTMKPPKWFDLDRKKYLHILLNYQSYQLPSTYHHLIEMEIVFNVSVRTCLLNSLVLTSQSCPLEDGRLNLFANAILPRLLSWGANKKIDSNCFHPLCIAGALQTIFICLTRMKSFDGMKGTSSFVKDDEHKIERENVQTCFRWALETLKANYSSFTTEKYACDTIRLAGLKLLLAIVSVDQKSSSFNDDKSNRDKTESILSPGEMAETLSVLRGAANMDSNQQVRELATHVLLSFGTGI